MSLGESTSCILLKTPCTSANLYLVQLRPDHVGLSGYKMSTLSEMSKVSFNSFQ